VRQDPEAPGTRRRAGASIARLHTTDMTIDLTTTTIHSFPHAFINKRGEAILVRTLDEARRDGLVRMYLDYRPRNSFGGLPPIRDEACIRWVKGMIADAVNLVALSFEKGIVGHGALFSLDGGACEMLLVVAPAEQRIGIGTELTHCLVQAAHDLGFEEIRLNTEAGNHVARRVFEKCGFRYLSRSLVDEVDMGLDLRNYHDTAGVPVREVMNQDVIAVRQDTPCREALEMLLRRGITTLPVVDDGDRLVGILSESDLLVEANIHKKVLDVLTRSVTTVPQGCALAKVISLFRSRKLRCIPVLGRHDELVGVVCRKDILAYYVGRNGAVPRGGQGERAAPPAPLSDRQDPPRQPAHG
jgi:CBS domain-containing protein/RimJ/RimL family protein N-acetyltransferase